MPSYDLHTHTQYSDGTLTPAELLARAHARGVEVLALTDHDVTDGLEEAAACARRHGIRLVPGVEISVSWERQTIHIVGLHVDPGNRALQAGLARIRERRDERGRSMSRRLEARGMVGVESGVREQVRGPIVSRTHYARYLVAAGYARDLKGAFKKYLGQGRPAYVSAEWAELHEAVGWIRDAGGQAVVAHPARYHFTQTRLRRFLTDFKVAGGEGLEVVSGSHSPEECRRFARVAVEHDLLASAGSDYHGPEKPWVELGRLAPLPEECQPVWSVW
jgi:predicted metal-dependent phosphoesterase TrpH